MRQLYAWVYVRVRTIKYCIESQFRPGLGQDVWYGGEKWSLIQGVCDPYWDLLRKKDGEWQRVDHVHKSNFRRRWSWANIVETWLSSWRFWRGYWWIIWIDEIVSRRPRSERWVTIKGQSFCPEKGNKQ